MMRGGREAMGELWLIWVPWLRKFFTKENGSMWTGTEAEAKAFVASAPQHPYKAVPWDDHAQQIIRGGP
jgi:hypothetical protein